MGGELFDVGHVRVHFEMDDQTGQDAFIEGYVLDAVERLSGSAVCEEFVFVQVDGDPDVDGGQVVVDAYGDVDAILDSERERWDEWVADGPVTDWFRPEYEVVPRLAEAFGEAGWWRGERLRALASRMSAATWGEFDERPAPADAFPEEDGEPVGWHRTLHLLSNQWGYEIDEEMDAYVQNLRMGAKIVGKTEGMDAAESFVADAKSELDDALEELEASGEAGEGIPNMDEDGEDEAEKEADDEPDD